MKHIEKRNHGSSDPRCSKSHPKIAHGSTSAQYVHKGLYGANTQSAFKRLVPQTPN